MSETTPVERPKPVAKPLLRPVLRASEPKGDDDMFDVRALLAVLRRRAKLILGCGVVITILSSIVIFQLAPRYTAEATVMLDTRRNQMIDFQSAMAGLPLDNTVIRSEIEILKSRTLAEQVADKLDLYDVPEFNGTLPEPTLLAWLMEPGRWAMRTLQRLTTRQIPRSAEPGDAAAERKLAVARALMGHMDAVNDGRSYLLRIRIEAADRDLVAKIANTYVDVYLLNQLEGKFDAVRRATAWLNEHLTDLREKASASDRAVQMFRDQHGLTEVRGATLTATQLGDISAQLTLAAADRAQKEQNLRQLQEQLKSGNVDAASVMASPLVQKLREQEAELVRQQAELATRYKPAHPTMVNLAAEIRDVKRKLDDEINKTIRGLEGDVAVARAREASLRETFANLQKNSAAQDTVMVQLRELEREAEADKAL